METVQSNVEYILKRSHRFDRISHLFETEETVKKALSRVKEKIAHFCEVAEHFVSLTSTTFLAIKPNSQESNSYSRLRLGSTGKCGADQRECFTQHMYGCNQASVES